MATVGSAIVCDRLRLYGNRSLCDRLRSTICDPRSSAIVCDHMETSLKTEVRLIGTRQQLAKLNVTSIAVGDETIEAKPSVRNLGSWFDSQLSMLTHISKVCGAAFYRLHNISRIRKFLSPDDTKSMHL